MVSKSFDGQLISHGYSRGMSSFQGVSVYRKQFAGDWYLVCVFQDNGKNLQNGRFQAVMEHEAGALYGQGSGARIFPMGLVISSDVSESRRCCEGTFACWYVDMVSRRLMIYEDQPGDFLDLRGIVEGQLFYGDPLVKTGRNHGSDRGPVRAFRITPVNTAIVLLNVLCFFYLEMIGDTMDNWFMYEHGAMLISEMGDPSQWYRLLTCTFLHFGFAHLFNNMLVLMYLGDNLEKVLGWWRYLLFYLICGVGSSVISCVWYTWTGVTNVLSVGASGAIFGVVGGLLYIVLRNRGRLEDIHGFQLVLLILFTLYHGITSLTGGVNNSAHIGGMFVGIVLAALLYRKRG